MSTYERNANRLTIFLFIVLAGLSIAGTMVLSGPIPIHFNSKGEANRWGSPATLLVLTFVCGCIIGLFWVIRRTPTEQMNFPGPRTPEHLARQRLNFDQLMATLQVIVAGLFLGIVSQISWVSFYHQKQIILWPSFLFIALIFLSIVVALVKAYGISAGR